MLFEPSSSKLIHQKNWSWAIRELNKQSELRQLQHIIAPCCTLAVYIIVVCYFIFFLSSIIKIIVLALKEIIEQLD